MTSSVEYPQKLTRMVLGCGDIRSRSASSSLFQEVLENKKQGVAWEAWNSALGSTRVQVKLISMIQKPSGV
jgi:hypothetical protein